MARNDGIDRTFARNQDLPTLDDVAKVQEHICQPFEHGTPGTPADPADPYPWRTPSPRP